MYEKRNASSVVQVSMSAPNFQYCLGVTPCYVCRKLDKSQFPKSRSTVRYTDGKGQKKFKGSPLLKATQVYTPSFGNAVPRWRSCTIYHAWDWLN